MAARLFAFHQRFETPDHPAGITVTKRSRLPDGDFMITEYCWGDASLWFLDDDEFTEDERQAAYLAYHGVRRGVHR